MKGWIPLEVVVGCSNINERKNLIFQFTLNQLYKKGIKEIEAQAVEFFYTSVIPFNVNRNPTLGKF